MKESVERRMGPLCVGMLNIVATERDDFFVTMHRRFVIFVAVVAEKTLHEPCFCVVGIHIQNSLEENFRYLPTFFRNRPSCMTPIDANHRVILVGVVEAWRSENSYIQHGYLEEK